VSGSPQTLPKTTGTTGSCKVSQGNSAKGLTEWHRIAMTILPLFLGGAWESHPQLRCLCPQMTPPQPMRMSMEIMRHWTPVPQSKGLLTRTRGTSQLHCGHRVTTKPAPWPASKDADFSTPRIQHVKMASTPAFECSAFSQLMLC
jgi:hypothetical protein